MVKKLSTNLKKKSCSLSLSKSNIERKNQEKKQLNEKKMISV